jgi:hypothetical protein
MAASVKTVMGFQVTKRKKLFYQLSKYELLREDPVSRNLLVVIRLISLNTTLLILVRDAPKRFSVTRAVSTSGGHGFRSDRVMEAGK